MKIQGQQQLDQAKLQSETQLAQAKLQGEMQLAHAKAQSDMQVEQAKLQAKQASDASEAQQAAITDQRENEMEAAREQAKLQMEERLAIALDHLRDSLEFYGEKHGLKIFRKHLGWYVEYASWPADAETRRAAKSQLCRMTSASDVEAALIALWTGDAIKLAA